MLPVAVAVVQVSTFAKLVGQSFEVQFTIAAINTLLTTAGAIRPSHDTLVTFLSASSTGTGVMQTLDMRVEIFCGVRCGLRQMSR